MNASRLSVFGRSRILFAAVVGGGAMVAIAARLLTAEPVEGTRLLMAALAFLAGWIGVRAP